MSAKLPIIGQQEQLACSDTLSLNIAEDNQSVEQAKGSVALITLGCAKNQVDSEVMLGTLRQRGYAVVSDIEQADFAIVNTCGFLESAVNESIDCVLEVAEQKKNGRLKKIIVAGCMPSRYQGKLSELLPEVDHFAGVDQVLDVAAMIDGPQPAVKTPNFIYDHSMPRQLSTKGHTAYVKIAEGCDRKCAFCIIPDIRGAFRSRSPESILREIRDLGALGVREVNLVGQDLTAYGSDHRKAQLSDLLQMIDREGAVDWVRLLYAYPVGTDDKLLDTIIELPSVCEYLDIPLQHSSQKVLKTMLRPVGRFLPRKLVEHIRGRQPQLSIRTTFIVGHPGETEEDFSDLENFVREGHFSSVGVFTFSREDGTASAELDGQVVSELAEERRERLMLAQQEVNAERLKSYLGRTIEVLLEGEHEESEWLLSGRSRFQAPEVDGVVIINDCEVAGDSVAAGQLSQVEITDIAGYDLVGTIKSI